MTRFAAALACSLLLACGSEDEGGSRVTVSTGGSSGLAGSAAQGGGAGAAGLAAGAAGLAGAGGSAASAGSEAGGGGATAGSGAGGTSGVAGASGAAGTSGASGAAGKSGAAGAAGKSGAAGAAGKSGAAGAAGKSGAGGAGAAGAGGAGAAGQSGGSGQAGTGGASGGGGTGGGACPVEMAYVPSPPVCVDRWEGVVEVMGASGWEAHSPFETLDQVSGTYRASSKPGVVPQGYISGVQAGEACAAAGKRLCTKTEYRAACQGPDVTTYPYGDTHVKGACNEGRTVHPVIELFGPGVPFDAVHLNDPGINQQADTLTLTGDKAQCTNGYGAFDMSGNLHEWVDDPAGTFLGGFYVDAEINGPGCLYTTTAHALGYHDYSTGFRCCRDPG